jgi:hypothetical protein
MACLVYPSDAFLRNYVSANSEMKRSRGRHGQEIQTPMLGDRNEGMFTAGCRGSMFLAEIDRYMAECDLKPSTACALGSSR